MVEPPLISFPLRPINGGHWCCALPKIGAWSYEPKVNGWRAMIHTPTGRMWNRKGQLLSIAHEFKPALEQLRQCPFDWVQAWP